MKELLNTGVNLPLEYDAETDALIGQIKGYSVAIKENLATSSYGCIFWITPGRNTDENSAGKILGDLREEEPELIKNFRIEYPGVAIALNRSEDEYGNVRSLKRFLYDFTSELQADNYLNCCGECGKTTDIGIYDAGDGAIEQACSECGAEYRLIRRTEISETELEKTAVTNEAVTEEKDSEDISLFTKDAESVAEEIPATEEDINQFILTEAEQTALNEEKKAIREAYNAPVQESEINLEELSLLMADDKDTEKNDEPVYESRNENSGINLEEISEFIATEEDILAAAEEEEVAEEDNTITEEEMNSFIFTEEEKSDSVSDDTYTSVQSSEETAETFSSLMFTGEEKEAERPKSKLFEEAEKEFAEEQARLAEHQDSEENADTVNNLLISDDGEITLKEIESENDDGQSDVTEYVDNTDYGEDFDIEEIESTVMKATVTTGHPQLEAEETPLEEDGSVPLINPNSQREERQVSPVDGPDAVQPLDYGQPIIEKMTEDDVEMSVAGAPAERISAQMSSPDDKRDIPFETASVYNVKTVRYLKSSNAFMGIIGALVLGFFGIALCVILNSAAPSVSFLGMIAVAVAVFAGYRVVGGSMDKKGIAVSFIVTIIMAVAGVIAVETFEMQSKIMETYFAEATIAESFEWLIYSLKQPDAMEVYGKGFAVSGAVALISDIILMIVLRKKA